MAVASAHHEGFAFDLGSRAHANDLQLFGVSLTHSDHHIGDESSAQAVTFSGRAFCAGGCDHDGIIHLVDTDTNWKGAFELTLGSLHRDGETVECDIHLVGNGDWVFTNT